MKSNQSANKTTLYAALRASFNLSNNGSESDGGFQDFSSAFDTISTAYFKACYGLEEERPTVADAPQLLSEFENLLSNRSDITRMRQLFGQLSCLRNFTQQPSNINKRNAVDNCITSSANVEELYDCIDVDDLQCIFNVNATHNCSTITLAAKQKRHCLAFVVDTTGSMGAEISHVRQVITNFVNSEENDLTLCYVLVAFNDYGYSGWPNTNNLEFGRIYDASYHSDDTGSTLFKVLDSTGSPINVGGANDLLNDINGLDANGGGDCPEYGMTGILKALELLDGINNPDVQDEGRHNLIVLTDASAKDDSLYQTVLNNANVMNKPNVIMHFFYSGVGCSNNFGHYETIKNATGGFSVSQINAGSFNEFVAGFIAFSQSSLSISAIASSKRTTPASCVTADISHFIQEFASLLETSQSTATITKPDGSTETVTIFTNSFAVYSADDPQPGIWRACVSSGTLQWSLKIAIDLDLSVDYLKEGENGVLLPTSKLSYACDSHSFTISTSKLSEISLNHSLYLDIIDNSGDILQFTELIECDGTLSGSITLPYGPVQYQLRGYDISLIPFAHIIPDSYVTFDIPQIVISMLGSPSVILNKGSKSLVRFSIINTKEGPRVLHLSPSTITTPPGLYTDYVSSEIIILKPQVETELQMMVTASSALSIGQVLQWSFIVVDSCSNNPITVNVPGILKQPIPVNVTHVSKYAITIQWGEPLLDDITSYTLTFDLSNGTITTVNVDNQTFQYRLTQLYPYQFVYASIAAYTYSGETAEIAPIEIITNESEPGQVSLLYSESNSLTSVNLIWSEPDRPNGIILYYELLVSNGSHHIINTTVNATVFNSIINDVVPHQRYTAVITPATSVGKGMPRYVEFYSREGVPVSSPQYHDHVANSPTAFELHWTPPEIEDRRGFITHYTIHIDSEAGAQTHRISGEITSFNVTNMPVYGRVNVSFSASTNVGRGPFSVPKSFYIATGVPSAPRDIAVNSLSSTSLVVKWEAPEYIRGKIFNYSIYYETMDGDEDEQFTIVPLEYNNTFIIEDLLSASTYNIKVAAVNYAGHGENSTEITLSLPVPPAAVSVPIVFVILILLGCAAAGIVFAVFVVRKQKPLDKEHVYENNDYRESDIDEEEKRKKGYVPEMVDHYEEIGKTQGGTAY
jgi:hypothetical protein